MVINEGEAELELPPVSNRVQVGPTLTFKHHVKLKLKELHPCLLALSPRRPPEDVGVDWLEAEALRGRPVHDHVDPQDLHRGLTLIKSINYSLN